jgi:hypothetical protein
LDFVYRLFTFALEYAIRKVEKKQERMKLKEIRQILLHAAADDDDVNLLGECVNALKKKKNRRPVSDASKEVRAEYKGGICVHIRVFHVSTDCRTK